MIGRTKPIPSGESIYESSDGLFIIRQRRFGSRVDYLLDVGGHPAPRGLREHDTLAEAKQAAQDIAEDSL